jgi:8-oxo-dGTP pyrophosphatase MutT (NUDIX family)
VNDRLGAVHRSLHRLLLAIYGRLPERLRLVVVHAVAPGYSVGTVPIIRRADGAVLLVRHTYKPHWGAPGGLLGRRESPADGAVREVREEAGIEVELIGEPAVVVDPIARRVDVVFEARPAVGVDPDSARASSVEIAEVRWFAADALPTVQREVADALDALARRAASG